MSAKFFYYPQPSGARRVTIDLEEPLGELYSDIIIDAVDGVSYAGGIRRSVGRTQEIITIQRDRLLRGEFIAHQFEALQNHLDRGYSVMFAADHTKMFCYPLSGTHNSGAALLHLGIPPFYQFIDSSISPKYPSEGDYMVIETSSPNMIREQVRITQVNSSEMTDQGGIVRCRRTAFEYSKRAFIRSKHFYPILKRPQSDIGQSIITNEGGRLFSLSLRLVVDYEALFAFHPDTIQSYDIGLGQSLIEEDDDVPDSGVSRSSGYNFSFDFAAVKVREFNPEVDFGRQDVVLDRDFD